jgi:hypothetical protein
METEETKTIVYEETPIIEPIEDPKLPSPLDTPELSDHSRHGKQTSSFIGKVVVFFVLFSLGIAGSIFVRPFLNKITLPTFPSGIQQEEKISESPSPTSAQVDQTAGWNTQNISVSGKVLTYSLPTGVEPPQCDGPSCASKGTYLPGKTRFTISSKTGGAPITNFAKLIVKDAGGKVFETKETTVAGLVAVDYSGSFMGLTTGGYTFTAMHGVMIQIAPTITIEMNHFAPNGITSEFEKDDAIFAQILKTFTYVSTPSATVK